MKKSVISGLFVFVFLLSGGVLPALAQTEVFMFIPGIPGNSVDARHADWIDILSLSQSLEEVAKGKPQCSIKAVKNLDNAGPLLWAAAVNAQIFPEVKIEFVRVQLGQRFYEIKLTNAFVASISTDSDAAVRESVVLKSAQVTITFWPQRPDGSLGQPVTSTFPC